MNTACAFVFPGQGSQSVGMGRELHDVFPAARAVFEEVDDALRQKLSALIFKGDEADLRLTANAQPALMTVSIAVIRVLEQEARLTLPMLARCVAGHSLGEYTALCAAGALSLADTARLLRRRGEAMQTAVAVGKGGMAALLGVTLEQAMAIAAEAAQGDICAAANDNAPGQVVISGHSAAIDRAIALAAAQGFKRSVRLPVSAPFHCSLMQPAATVMQQALAEVTFHPLSVPLLANVTATLTEEPERLRDVLVKQVTGMVRWRESMLALPAMGISRIVECGAGSVLCGLMKRIDPAINATAVHTPADIDVFVKNYQVGELV